MATKNTPKKEPKKPEETKPEVVEAKTEAALAVIPETSMPPVPTDYRSKLTRPQIEIIKTTIAKGSTDDELKMFLYVCERTKLDPFTKQIHLVPRWDSKLGKEIRVPIVGIDGLRSVAERTGDYAGNDDPVFDDETKPRKATVNVYKMVQGNRVPFTATARWDQYVPKKKDGSIASPLWEKMPHLMLGKCAEALALRKAFPQVMSGLYVAEEMQQAQPGTAAQIEDPFQKAKVMIAGVKDAAGLGEFKKKLAASKKYTPEQKVELNKAIDDQLKKITNTNETETVPELHADDAVGEEPAGV